MTASITWFNEFLSFDFYDQEDFDMKKLCNVVIDFAVVAVAFVLFNCGIAAVMDFTRVCIRL